MPCFFSGKQNFFCVLWAGNMQMGYSIWDNIAVKSGENDMNYGTLYNAYPSARNNQYAKNAMVATSQPLAAQAGMDIIKKGGNAVDAAIAAAAMLTVVEPCSNGIGGDAFAIIWSKGRLHGLNASGPAAMAASAEKLRNMGFDSVPDFGMYPLTVPGQPAAWAALSEKFGLLPFADLLEPAIKTAARGYAVTSTVAYNWKRAFERYSKMASGPEFLNWYKIFAPKGRSPKAGEVWKSHLHAETLSELAETKCESFYRGSLANKIIATSKAYNGWLQAEDLGNYAVEWVEPLRMAYRGYEVCELPPNGHGIAALMALGICSHFDLEHTSQSRTYHIMIEAMKLAFADVKEYVADPKHMAYKNEALLDPEYLKERAAMIGKNAIAPAPGLARPGGTVYLCTADSEGTMVSYIQSNYKGFGSGIVADGSAIALHNRGANFNLVPGHPNCLEGGKKPYHTIIPGFLMKNGQPQGPFGVMGAFMQPQGHLQILSAAIDSGLSPQECLDAPRWQWIRGKAVSVEASFPRKSVYELRELGHDISVSIDTDDFGRGQIIWKTPEGTYCGGTESRCDGHIASL